MADAPSPQAVIPLSDTPVQIHPGADTGHLGRLAVLNVVNYSDGELTVTIYAVPDEGVAANENILHQFVIPAHDTQQIGRGQDFPSKTSIWGVISAESGANAHVTLVPVEM